MKSSPKPSRPWRVVAEEVCREEDTMKTVELVSELIDSLDEQELSGQPGPGLQAQHPELGPATGKKRPRSSAA